jgi:hypothetical protein
MAEEAIAIAPELDRSKRRLPPTGANPPVPEFDYTKSPAPLAPSQAGSFNTLRLGTWLEIQLLTSHGAKIAHEKVQLFSPDGSIITKTTNAQGVARFEHLPLIPPAGTNWVDTRAPAIVIPDILEESCPQSHPGNRAYPKDPDGFFGKNVGSRDDYRKRDGSVHFITQFEQECVPIKLDQLTEAHKLQHFIDSYMTNHARYNNPVANHFDSGSRYWSWSKGATCNQHVNFFMSYWCNYNAAFAASSVASSMHALPMYDSDLDLREHVHIRGFSEFVEELAGVVTYPYHEKGWQTGAAHYLRLHQYIDHTTGGVREHRTNLLDLLAPINVYSIADIKRVPAEPHPPAALPPNADAIAIKKHDAAVKKYDGDVKERARLLKSHNNGVADVKAWLKKYRTERGHGWTDDKIDGLSDDECLAYGRGLDDGDAIDQELIKNIARNALEYDHHCGVLLIRHADDPQYRQWDGAKGDPKNKRVLYTFSADGGKASDHGELIELKTLRHDLDRKFPFFAIWKMKPLDAGGFASSSSEDNAGQISIDNPPRFIRWS